MSISPRLAGTLLATSALLSPSLALAQATLPEAEPVDASAPDSLAAIPPEEEEVEISIPGGDQIIVTGQRDRNIARVSDQVVSVLSTTEIARTGEGNIAGALGRVTGLSVVGSGYVYVRGLGDRYSLALLNGSPLPSPEPLKRVVPLDLFPSSVIASSLVQKSYSVNYPGEFGGGVINLTTRAIPTEGYIHISGGITAETETTGKFGYSYFGSRTDWTGFDNGQRDIPPAMQAYFASGELLGNGNVDAQTIGREIVRFSNSTLQRLPELPVNFSTSLSAGENFSVGDSELGLIFAAGFNNRWQNRDALQQRSLSADLSTIDSNFRRVTTSNRVVINGLFGLGFEFGSNMLRWTNFYVRDTIKQARLGLGNRQQTSVDFMQQDTAWYERQLIDTQLVGEFELASGLNLDLRGSYANTQREAPYEMYFEYVRSNSAADPFGALFVNRLNGGNGGDATATFSDLNEDLLAGSADLSYLLTSEISATVGGAWSQADRTSSRRKFQFRAPSNFIDGVGVLRPDLLLAPGLVDYFNIDLIEDDPSSPAFAASLDTWAGYGKFNWQATDELSIDAGVRYETADLLVAPIPVFNTGTSSTAGSQLSNDYWLPATTITWQPLNELQFRASASKTIARPQFRELISQTYFDPDSNRQYRGNPLLIDSQLYNAETRVEWYFDRDQRLSLAGFYKRIKNPIETFITGGDQITSFANAPEAELYGAEIDLQKYFDLYSLGGDESWFTDRRIVLIGNYTYTRSNVRVDANDAVRVFGAFSTIATDYFQNGLPLTGQSDHIANIQLGLESTEKLSQFTVLLTYASERVISRGLNGSPPQPDVVEQPGLRLDFVAREGFDMFDTELELKVEARNITGRRHVEFQHAGTNRIDTNSYDEGRSFALSASLRF